MLGRRRQYRRALMRNVALFVVAVAVVVAALTIVSARSVPTIQVVTASAVGGSGPPGSGATSVTANGYVVARTKASVSAKIPGRLAYLGVSEGSFVRSGDVIARLDNADYEAAVPRPKRTSPPPMPASSKRAPIATSSCTTRTARATSGAGNPALMSEQELELATSKTAQAEARLNAAVARERAAEAGLHMAEANNENTIIHAPFTRHSVAQGRRGRRSRGPVSRRRPRRAARWSRWPTCRRWRSRSTSTRHTSGGSATVVRRASRRRVSRHRIPWLCATGCADRRSPARDGPGEGVHPGS